MRCGSLLRCSSLLLLLWLWAAKCTDEQQLQQERDQLSQQQVVLSKHVHTQVPLPLAVAKQVSVEQAEQFHKMSDATEVEGQLAAAAAAAAVEPQEVFQSTDRQLLLDAHNRLRSLHQSPGLTWSNTLAQQRRGHGCCVWADIRHSPVLD